MGFRDAMEPDVFIVEHKSKQRLLSHTYACPFASSIHLLQGVAQPSFAHSSRSFLLTHLLPVFGTATWHPALTALFFQVLCSLSLLTNERSTVRRRSSSVFIRRSIISGMTRDVFVT